MSLIQTKQTTALGLTLAAALILASAGTASADPGKGLRWSDFAWGSSSRGQPARPGPSYARPLVQTHPRAFAAPQPFGYAPAAAHGRLVVSPHPSGRVVVRSVSCR